MSEAVRSVPILHTDQTYHRVVGIALGIISVRGSLRETVQLRARDGVSDPRGNCARISGCGWRPSGIRYTVGRGHVNLDDTERLVRVHYLHGWKYQHPSFVGVVATGQGRLHCYLIEIRSVELKERHTSGRIQAK